MRGYEIYNKGCLELSIMYAKEYEVRPKNFLVCFLKYDSIKMACYEIVQIYKKIGAFADCEKLGKDFSEYANKQNIDEKWKRVLAELLLIIWSILN